MCMYVQACVHVQTMYCPPHRDTAHWIWQEAGFVLALEHACRRFMNINRRSPELVARSIRHSCFRLRLPQRCWLCKSYCCYGRDYAAKGEPVNASPACLEASLHSPTNPLLLSDSSACKHGRAPISTRSSHTPPLHSSPIHIRACPHAPACPLRHPRAAHMRAHTDSVTSFLNAARYFTMNQSKL